MGSIMGVMTPQGWQQPDGTPIPSGPPPCLHVGLIFAIFTINSHALGSVWECQCGARWKVVKENAHAPRRLDRI